MEQIVAQNAQIISLLQDIRELLEKQVFGLPVSDDRSSQYGDHSKISSVTGK